MDTSCKCRVVFQFSLFKLNRKLKIIILFNVQQRNLKRFLRKCICIRNINGIIFSNHPFMPLCLKVSPDVSKGEPHKNLIVLVLSIIKDRKDKWLHFYTTEKKRSIKLSRKIAGYNLTTFSTFSQQMGLLYSFHWICL